MGKFICKSFGMALVVLLGFAFYQQAQGGPSVTGTVSAYSGNLEFYLNQGESFLRINSARARMQIQSMASSLPSNLGDWVPRNGSNWIKSTAQKASQVAGDNPANAAKRVPVVNSALDATKQRIASVGQSISGAASGF